MDPETAKRVEREAAAAAAAFPGFRKVSQHQFSVTFPGSAPYGIVLPRNYPVAPPLLDEAGHIVTIHMTDNWHPAFQLKDIIDELLIRSQAVMPPLVAPSELDMAVRNPSFWKVTSPEDCRRYIDNLPGLKDIQARADAASSNLSRSVESTKRLLAEAKQNSIGIKDQKELRFEATAKVRSANDRFNRDVADARKEIDRILDEVRSTRSVSADMTMKLVGQHEKMIYAQGMVCEISGILDAADK